MSEAESIVDWLNDNSGAVQAIAVIVLGLVTAWYAWSNAHLVREAREQTRPYISLDFEMSESSFNVVLANHGNRAASDLTFNVIRDLSIVRRRKDREDETISIGNLGAIRKGIPYFPPGRRLVFDFSWPREVLHKDRPDEELQLEVELTYKYEDDSFSETFQFDASMYREGMLYRSVSGGNENTERQLREIARSLSSMDSRQRRGPFMMSFCPTCAQQIN